MKFDDMVPIGSLCTTVCVVNPKFSALALRTSFPFVDEASQLRLKRARQRGWANPQIGDVLLEFGKTYDRQRVLIYTLSFIKILI